MRAPTLDCVAVFDVGKTNLKVVVLDREGKVHAETARPNAPLSPDAAWPYLRPDTDAAWAFLVDALKQFARDFPIQAIVTAAHGCEAVLIDRDDAIVMPPFDYEDVTLEIDRSAYDAIRPPFEETLTPSLPRGINLGRHLFHVQRHFPGALERADAFLCYPQFWGWRLSGTRASEVSYLGAHTDFWRPREARLSSLVERFGWTRLFPPLRSAWETLGVLRPEVAASTGLSPTTRIVCGAHDSNASLVPYLRSRREPFTLISTGTWVIIMAVGGVGPLDPAWDTLTNVNVRGEPVPTGRFMGGREFALLAGDSKAEAGAADVAAIVASGTMAVPAFSDQGGPFAGHKGRVDGEPPVNPAGRTALATLYSALMTAHMVDLMQAPGALIVEGGFNRSPAFAATLAALTPGCEVLVAPISGAAAGAAMLAWWEESFEPPKLARAAAWTIPGLAEYRRSWEQKAKRR